jgi:hypothetical protein
MFRRFLPGMDSKDVDVSLQNNMLVLQGETKFEDMGMFPSTPVAPRPGGRGSRPGYCPPRSKT